MTCPEHSRTSAKPDAAILAAWRHFRDLEEAFANAASKNDRTSDAIGIEMIAVRDSIIDAPSESVEGDAARADAILQLIEAEISRSSGFPWMVPTRSWLRFLIAGGDESYDFMHPPEPEERGDRRVAFVLADPSRQIWRERFRSEGLAVVRRPPCDYDLDDI